MGIRLYHEFNNSVTKLLKTIAYIEAAQNNKKVWYLGYDPCNKTLKDCKNITYRQLHNNSQIDPSECCGKRYDLIIVDEMTTFKNPAETEARLMPCLNKGGKIIFVGTVEKKYADVEVIAKSNENVNNFIDKPYYLASNEYITLIIDDNDL